MEEADRQYFEAMETLFTSPGWRLLNDDIVGWQDAIATQWRTLKPESLAFAQGRYDAFEQVLKHFKLCETLKAQALEQAQEDLDATNV